MGNRALAIGHRELTRIRPVSSMSKFVNRILIFIYDTVNFVNIVDRVLTSMQNKFLLPVALLQEQLFDIFKQVIVDLDEDRIDSEQYFCKKVGF